MSQDTTSAPRRVATHRKIGLGTHLIGLLSELLISAGIFVLLFVVWQLFWTDVVAGAEMRDEVARFESSTVTTTITSGTTTAASTDVVPDQAVALVRIPRFGRDFVAPIYEGTGLPVLSKGVGHYVGTAQPGAIGNFAMAGHRTTYGKPFNRIAELALGDVIVVETKASYFVYRVTGSDIVDPDHSEVVLPVPEKVGMVATKAVLTMTSCHPEFSARQRYIAYGELAATYSRAEGLPATVLAPPAK